MKADCVYRETFDTVLEENMRLKSQVEQWMRQGAESEANANRLALQLEEKYKSDMVALDELQSKVISVTNLKQQEIVSLEYSLQKVIYLNCGAKK